MNAIARIMNSARRLENLFPGYFPGHKHNHYKDFGYPDTLSFDQFFSMYRRNGLAKAGVNKTVKKVWETRPALLEQSEQHDETSVESDIRKHFEKLRVWQCLATAERRSLVGSYAGVILRIADSKPFKEPLARVTGGLAALVEVIPAWEGQLTVSTWDTDETSETYGQPSMFSFNEAAVGNSQASTTSKHRSFEVHPDRVIVWSDDGTVHGSSLLMAGYNDLLTLEKVAGAGGEGFWKNSKSAPVLQVDKDAKLKDMAAAMGVGTDEITDAMNEQVEDWQKGFDQLLMLQGIEAKTLGVTLPSPEHFYGIALQSFAASIDIPTKILVGMQTGERASTEDAKEWSKTCMARRSDHTIPNIMALVDRLEMAGILPESDWHIGWTDLTESTMAEKIERADKMAGVNQKMKDSGEFVFTPEEIRETVDLAPLSEADRFVDEPLGEDGP